MSFIDAIRLPSKTWFYRRRRRVAVVIGFALLVYISWDMVFNGKFIEIENMDFPGLGDFPCEQSQVSGKCAFFVGRHLTLRAKWRCISMGSLCKGFVFNSGTMMMEIKNAVGTQPVYAPGMVLYIRNKYVSRMNLTIEECAPVLDQSSSHGDSDSDMACKLPKLDPFDKAVMPLMRDKGKLTCPGRLVTSMKDGVLVFDPKGTNVQQVEYETIIRVKGDFGHGVGRRGILTRSDNTVILNHDTVRVAFRNDKGEHQMDFHMDINPIPGVSGRGSKSPGIPVNVLIIGFDSTSRSHFMRKLPRVKQWLDKELDTFSFSGYSTVGDGTTPAMIAMLVGKLEEQLPEARRSRGGVNVDVWPFIFPEFHDNGYVTAWSEDQAKYGIFQYRLEGFKVKPVDHYLRNFWVAVSAHTGDMGSLCIGSEPAFEKRFRFIESLFEKYPKTRKLSLEFFCITHDDMNDIGYVQDDFLRFLGSMKSKGYLDNTMLVVMGDHGARYGPIRSTIIGKLEERLPYLSISVPKWFKSKHPDVHNALKANTDRLTSPFDLHATFLHILRYPDTPKVDVGQSLFQEVPKSRTCEVAGIPVHYCTCMDWKQVSPGHHHIKQLAEEAVRHINERIQREGVADKCAELRLTGIHNAVFIAPSRQVQTFKGSDDMYYREIYEGDNPKGMCNYQVQLKTSPNDGIFEVTGYISSYSPHVNPMMSRLDAYGDQPQCITESHPHMREVCYCLDKRKENVG
ncbi:uncharacterized protein LOC5503789 isoform X2 [Nematostella vectensis]|uniref:uncharacterized protein LOC5503789 isoform X2 n=1 Tax=Nematostella vectensis TaxID=45351 RepID=UPI002076F3A8|nr:uncharacterized protein LOC5503789 isoform X2 [Nematostella vectensis]